MTESEMLNLFDMSRSDTKNKGGKLPGGYIEGTEDCLNRNIHFAIWRDPSFTTGQTVFFSEPWREKQKKLSHGTRLIRWASAAMALSSACGCGSSQCGAKTRK